MIIFRRFPGIRTYTQYKPLTYVKDSEKHRPQYGSTILRGRGGHASRRLDRETFC